MTKNTVPNNVVYLTLSTFDFNEFLMRLVVAMSRVDMNACELAYRANLSYSTICRVMARKSLDMRVATVSKLAAALQVSTDFLLGNRKPSSKREIEIEAEAQDNLRIQRRRNAQ